MKALTRSFNIALPATLLPLLFIVMWSSGYVVGKVALPFVGPYTLIFIRFASAALILLGVALASRGGALAAWLGALLALVCATVLGADRQTVQSGLYGFSAVLSAMAVAVVFIEPSRRSALVGGLAVVFTVIIQGALNHWLAPYGVPSLTAAYLIAMWLFTLPKMDLLIHPHQPNRSSSFGRN